MVSALGGRHPDHDTLADLAADVLPEHEARVIEAHVIGCPRCAQLLADAEGIRRLLRTADPGPMPAQVWDRIAGALAADAARGAEVHRGLSPEVAAVAGGATHAPGTAMPSGADPWLTQEWPVEAARGPQHRSPRGPSIPVAAAAPMDAPTSQWERFVEEAEATSGPLPGSAATEMPDGVRMAGPATDSHQLLPRRRTGSLRTRRDVRTEGTSHVAVRFGRPLAIAAGVLVLAGAGGLAVLRLPIGGDTSADTASGGAERAAASSAAEGAFASVIRSTGTDYTTADLPVLAAQLAAAARQPAPAAGGASPLAASSSALVGPQSSRQGAVSAASGGGAQSDGLGSTAASLTDPGRLAECLDALEAGGQQPIAVDLARYEGRDAAIIVLAGRDGGYEVWAVGRDCGAGDARKFGYVPVPPSR